MKLKPCPRCGGKGKSCNALVGYVLNCKNETCQFHITSNSKEEAEYFWNSLPRKETNPDQVIARCDNCGDAIFSRHFRLINQECVKKECHGSYRKLTRKVRKK